jgi:hypothetical protein
MHRVARLTVVATVGVVAAWAGWVAYAKRALDPVPYTAVGTVDGVEFREYPEGVVVEASAPTEDEAVGRLNRYLAGANEPPADVVLTRPVESESGTMVFEERVVAPIRTGGTPVETNTPYRMATEGDRVTVGVFLPADYTVETAPSPTNPAVRVRYAPPRTLAVRPFSWWASDDRTRDNENALLTALDDYDLDPVSDPVLFRYDPPLTPPFLRHNEVAVELAAA